MSSDCSPHQPRNHKHGRPIIIGLGYILRVHCASSKTIRSRKVRSLSRNGGEALLSFRFYFGYRFDLSHTVYLLALFHRSNATRTRSLRARGFALTLSVSFSSRTVHGHLGGIGVSRVLSVNSLATRCFGIKASGMRINTRPRCTSLVYVTWWRFRWGQRDINVGLGKECHSRHIKFSSEQFILLNVFFPNSLAGKIYLNLFFFLTY